MLVLVNSWQQCIKLSLPYELQWMLHRSKVKVKLSQNQSILAHHKSFHNSLYRFTFWSTVMYDCSYIIQ
uniref:Uncharacterized protein n=1 Tax=Anguilla anguilla TaxID=7936 RepID=A0A0E9X8W3_ANGAN